MGKKKPQINDWAESKRNSCQGCKERDEEITNLKEMMAMIKESERIASREYAASLIKRDKLQQQLTRSEKRIAELEKENADTIEQLKKFSENNFQ